MLVLALMHSDDEAISLPDQARVGRLSGCELRIDDPAVSRDHARFAWSGAHWTVRDLASTAGTSLRGKQLGKGEEAEIHVDDVLRFGGVSLRVLAAEAPEQRESRPGTLAVITNRDGRVTLRRDGEPRPDDGTRTADSADGRVISTGTLVLRPDRQLEEIAASVRTSREEDVDLGVRAHHMLLYVLARHAIEAHLGRGLLDDPTRGWVPRELLVHELKGRRGWVNLAVFRAREELRRLEFSDADRVVWRSEGGQSLRLGTWRVEIVSPPEA